MTPYVWICEQFSSQSILIDFNSPNLLTQTVNLKITLTSASDSMQSVNLLKAVDSNTNGFNRVDFKLSKKLSPGRYNLNVSATASVDDYTFSGSLNGIECRANQNGIYIITDKPVYKDSEKGSLHNLYSPYSLTT